LETKLDQIKGIGPKTIYKLRNANIWSTYDLILHVPKSYKDFSISNPFELKHKANVTLYASVVSKLINNPYGKVFSTTFDIKVFDQVIKVIIFNRKYLSKQIKEGQMIIVQGVYHLYRQQLLATEIKLNIDVDQSIQPIYHIKDVSDYTVSKAVTTIFNENQVQIFEIIPEVFIKKYKLISRIQAYKNLHMPKTFKDIEQAVRRLKYEEAFFLELKVVSDQSIFIKRKPKVYDIEHIKSFIKTIPYELTYDQKQAVNDIYRDFKKEHAMFRLIQGDVGSGKTVVSLIAIMAVISNGEQAVFMAPTNLLANQQFETYKKLAPTLKIGLLTQKTPNKEQMIKDIKDHAYDLIIGTHALIEDYVKFSNLGLVVIDEQHKFGVETRNQLIDKSHSKDVLYLTATPIPRTLAMITFGQQNVSLIKEKPQQKTPIDTQYVTKDKLEIIFKHIDQEINLNHHVYVVVPAITSDKVDDNIESVFKLLSQKLDGDIFMIHGQMKKQQQEETMQHFKEKPSVLLATTMIEVGIDIPTATTMVIFSAEFFGLSQLHQLRGRVGRSALASTCYLVSEKTDIERLELLSKIDDGFELANYDLKLRGPGDFLGKDQSGYLKFHFLEIMQDQKIIEIAQKDVLSLMKQKDFKTNYKYKYLNRYIKETMKI
jgi:ATP-dependent DNA helicase RecG